MHRRARTHDFDEVRTPDSRSCEPVRPRPKLLGVHRPTIATLPGDRPTGFSPVARRWPAARADDGTPFPFRKVSFCHACNTYITLSSCPPMAAIGRNTLPRSFAKGESCLDRKARAAPETADCQQSAPPCRFVSMQGFLGTLSTVSPPLSLRHRALETSAYSFGAIGSLGQVYHRLIMRALAYAPRRGAWLVSAKA